MGKNSLGTNNLDAKRLAQATALAGALSIPGVVQATNDQSYQIINGGKTILVPVSSLAPTTAKVGMETLGGKSTPVAGATFNTANTTTQIAGGTRDGDNIYGGVKTAVSWNSNIATISVGVARREIDKTQDNYQNAVKAQAGAYHVTQNGTRIGLEAGYQKVNDVNLGSNTNIAHSTRTETTPAEIRTINTTTTTTNAAKLHGSSAVTFSGSTSMPIGNNWGVTAQVGHTNVNYTDNHKEGFSTAKAELTHYGKTVNISPFVEQNFGDRTDTTAGAKVLYNGKHFQVGAMASHNSTDGNAMSIAIQYPPSEKPNARRPKTAQEHRYSLVNNTTVADMTPHDMAKYSRLIQNQQTRVNEVISSQPILQPIPDLPNYQLEHTLLTNGWNFGIMKVLLNLPDWWSAEIDNVINNYWDDLYTHASIWPDGALYFGQTDSANAWVSVTVKFTFRNPKTNQEKTEYRTFKMTYRR